jgi:RNA polymerase sigma-70 factor (ECF subfamily)
MLYSPGYAALGHPTVAAFFAPDGLMNDEPIDLGRLARMDPDAIAQAHDRFFAELYRYVRYRVPSEDVAEDIVSDVFIRLLDAIRRGKSPHTNLRGWLLSTSSNAVNDFFRRAYQRDSSGLDETLASDDPGPTSILDNQARQADLQAALAQLTPEQQHVIALRFGAGYSLQETAELMGKGINAIKALQFRAIGALRRHMGTDLP